MPSSASTIAAQIAALDARISNTSTIGYASMGDASSSASFTSLEELILMRNQLQYQYDLLTGAVRRSVRGRVVGLPGGTVSQNQSIQ
ncbi:MAG: hypothetical protein KGN77_05250 [Xanthomonadaceae bacterium]|nr:hypothetical protein [Xanthomonadaceae bacterium]